MRSGVPAVVVAVAVGLAGVVPTEAAHSAPGPVRNADPQITVATYNVCKRDCGRGKWAWKRRVAKMARTIVASGSDVVAIQEAYGMTRPLMRLLGRHGYAQAGLQAGTQGCGAGCVQESHILYNTRTITHVPLWIPNPRKPAQCRIFPDEAPPQAPLTADSPQPIPPRRPVAPGADDPDYRQAYLRYQRNLLRYEMDLKDHGDQLAAWHRIGDLREAAQRRLAKKLRKQYRQNSCAVYDSWSGTRDGSAAYPSLKQLTGPAWRGTATERLAGWAILTHAASGTQFLAASLHLPPEKTRQAERARKAATRGLLRHLAQVRRDFGAEQLPTFVAGDLNSFDRRQPRGAQWLLGKAGYTDAWRAPLKVNGDYNTVNYTGIQRDPFPQQPIRSRRGTPARVDYVFSNVLTPVRYEVFLRLRGDRFDNAYRASDHNLVKTTWSIPATDPVSGATAGRVIDPHVVHMRARPWLAKPFLAVN